eukprot:CAMPEP_0197246256 /NCGR_PEP_ID=MMETSP1429-20130617/10759_1 /TAXON_ID=49237 /ORGANISM="Chaetoceros  sp., Strain UNC1202" /LENGTH=315 /DNA_ID=CAMNT_0042706875 /DNA_START=33 /DNA_END=980 /DNA_ORIENTATION=+
MTKLNRFNGWVANVAFSCVVLGTIVETEADRGPVNEYIISCCSIAIILGCCAFFGHLFAGDLVGSPFEGLLSLIVCGLWCAAVAVIHNPMNDLAVEQTATYRIGVKNPNLYFFSWASFVSSAYVLTSLGQEYRVVNVDRTHRNIVRWYMLLVASIIVLGSSSKLKTKNEGLCDMNINELCRRTNYAVALGVIGAALAIIPIVLTHMGALITMVEGIIAFTSLVFYCVGVAAITNSKYGPANTIGNLYFASWAGFLLSVLLTFTCVKERFGPEEPDEETESQMGKSESKEGKGDVERQHVGEQVEEIQAEGKDDDE